MKNPKPIKRHPAIIELSKDHHFALLFIWKIREGLKKSVEPERISRYIIHFFDTDLIKHFADEEEVLFNKIPPENRLVKEAIEQHRSIKQIVVDIRNSVNDLNTLEQFADMLEKHIRFEERELFNYLQENISEATLQEVAASLKSRQPKPSGIWNDIFWETKAPKV